MDNSLRLIAALLDYPTELSMQIVDNGDEILVDCPSLDAEGRQDVADFMAAHVGISLLDWQQAYCAQFDVAPSTSLYLFEHVYGSSRKRGAAMSSLVETYREHGLEISNGELPDYLPVFLDFLSRLDDRVEVNSYLADIAPILKSISEVLEKHSSPYALLILPLLSMAEQGTPHPLPQEQAETCAAEQ